MSKSQGEFTAGALPLNTLNICKTAKAAFIKFGTPDFYIIICNLMLYLL